ncbi:hypothetical protein OS493_016991 [Desmophyllum pertusum]|uniref:Sodium/hydrogen exchanger n=1 Tax=Desmophyllum pertusum TaxID=174260 RepID=A0A9W9YP13_9CNID|nr:hypothetical protein OS493_016991 [Desmophyllum pertusum]
MKVKMTFVNPAAILLIVGVLIIRINAAVADDPAITSSHSNTSNGNESLDHGPPPQLKVAKFDFGYVGGPLTIIVWILIASLAKLGFHLSHKLSSVVPESCFGNRCLGLGMDINRHGSGLLLSHILFFYVATIVLEAGYFLQDRAFFDNIGTILLYAVVGTIFNTFTVGLSLYGLSGKIGVDLRLMHALTFSSLIAAVDPVAVLAVFEEIHVNVMLYILVFGESLLNDAVTVVLYHLFEALTGFDEVTYKEILIGFASFFVVSIGGTLLGLLWGLATAFVTKYTDHVRVIEPIFVFVMSYLSYLTAELFHLSGIMSIVTCAIIMKPYVELNISRKSHTTIKYFLKMASSSSETLIFMFLGVRVVTWHHVWNTQFVFVTLIFILLFRALGVVILTFFANKGRLNKLSAVDQFIMSYGGIRGAVSFSLAILLVEDHFPMKNMFVTTTIVIVLFTVFFQGMTIKPLVRILHVKLREKEQLNMYAELNVKFLDHLVAGIEEISGHRGHGYYWEMIEYFHTHYLRRWLIRDSYQFVHDEDILLAYRRLAYKDALTRLEKEGSAAAMFPSGLSCEMLARSAFEASAITAAESSEDDEDEDENKPMMLRAGDDVRVPDAIQVDWRAAGVPSGGELEIYDTASSHNLNNLIERNRKSFRHRKMYRNNLIDDDEEFFRERGYLLPMKPRETAYQNQTLKQLSAIFEEDDQNGRSSPTMEAPVGPIPSSSEDDEPGITFEATPRGRLGRYPSFENQPRRDSAPDELPSEDTKTNKDKDESKPKEDSPTEPDSIPLESFVVDIDGEKVEEKNAESVM